MPSFPTSPTTLSWKTRVASRGCSADAPLGKFVTQEDEIKTIHHVFDVKAPPARLFAAISTGEGLAAWWTTEVRVEPGIGGTIDFTFSGDFNSDMRVTELNEPSAIGWECVGGHEPWAENTFRFELEGKDAGTLVRFWQHYATELSDDAYGTYNFNWAYYLESLRLLCETGVGKPFQAGVEQIRSER